MVIIAVFLVPLIRQSTFFRPLICGGRSFVWLAVVGSPTLDDIFEVVLDSLTRSAYRVVLLSD